LECNNPNAKIVLLNELNVVELLFGTEIAFKSKSYKLFLQELTQDAYIDWKIRLSITFSSQVQKEWFKSCHVDKNNF